MRCQAHEDMCRKMIDNWLKKNEPSVKISDEPMPHLSGTIICSGSGYYDG